jgi:Ca2+-binding RTX toxin-like protein
VTPNHADDVISGGEGTDWAFGGSGNDVLDGGPGENKLIDWTCKSHKPNPCHHAKIQPCSSWVKPFVDDIKRLGEKDNPHSKIQVFLAPECSASNKNNGKGSKK